MKTISDITKSLKISEDAIIPYGRQAVKIDTSKISETAKKGKLVLVTSACNANAAGEGKTSTEIGLNDGLNLIGVKSIACLREPSLGVSFGNKGPADGALKAKVVTEDVNYHFTGDIHALTTTINMIAAEIDNTIYQGNALNIDPSKIVWKRAIDICDRSLRSITVAQNDKKATPYSCEFVITVAHELSTIMMLSHSLDEFVERAEKATIAYTFDNKPVTVKDLHMSKCIRKLMQYAMMPNLTYSVEGNPLVISGLPFANISCGSSAAYATDFALSHADVVLQEAGFGSDLGAEKFMDIVCPVGNYTPSAIVAVISCRSLKLHGGVDKDRLTEHNPAAVKAGLPNMAAHLKNLKRFGVPILVAVNKFSFDKNDEINIIKDFCASQHVLCEVTSSALDGASGAYGLAMQLMNILNTNKSPKYTPAYNQIKATTKDIKALINKICIDTYGAKDVEYTEEATKQIKSLTKLDDISSYKICMCKTPASITDDPKILGAPTDFNIHIREVRVFTGAKLIVPISGSLLMLPGLGKTPRLLDSYGE